MRQLLKSGKAADTAFATAFFFLPLSKPLLYISLFVAFVLFFASERFAEARRDWRMLPWMWPALLLAVLPWLSLLVHDGGRKDWSYLHLSYYWLMAFVTFLAAGRLQVQPWIKAFLAAVFIVFCYVQIRFPGRLEEATGLAALGNYILYSQFLAIGLVLLSVLYRHETSRILKPVYLLGMLLFFYGLISGNGRSGMLALLVLLPFILGNLFPRTSRIKMLLGCVLALAVVLLSPKVQMRINDGIKDVQLLQQHDAQTSLGYRAEMWKTAWNVWLDHPLLGAGPSGFSTAWHSGPLSNEAQAFVEPHNAFLFYAASYGAIGLAALVWLYAAVLWAGWRARATMAGGIVFAFAVIVIFGSLTNTMFMGATSHAWLMLFIGLQGSLSRREAAA